MKWWIQPLLHWGNSRMFNLLCWSYDSILILNILSIIPILLSRNFLFVHSYQAKCQISWKLQTKLCLYLKILIMKVGQCKVQLMAKKNHTPLSEKKIFSHWLLFQLCGEPANERRDFQKQVQHISFLNKTLLSFWRKFSNLLSTLNKGAHAWRGFWHDDASVLRERHVTPILLIIS